jgi:hypothetical protein
MTKRTHSLNVGLLAVITLLSTGWMLDRWDATCVIQALETERAPKVYAPAETYPRLFAAAFAPLDSAARKAGR